MVLVVNCFIHRPTVADSSFIMFAPSEQFVFVVGYDAQT